MTPYYGDDWLTVYIVMPLHGAVCSRPVGHPGRHRGTRHLRPRRNRRGDGMTTEYSVVWRWKTNPYHDEFSDERRKVYKTEWGAQRLLAKLQKNDGRYDVHIETEPTRGDDGLTVEHWRIDYARIETRQVGPWS